LAVFLVQEFSKNITSNCHTAVTVAKELTQIELSLKVTVPI